MVQGNILEAGPYASRPERESRSKGAPRDRRQDTTSSTSAQYNSTHGGPSRTPPTLHPFTSSPLAPCDGLLAHVVTCANRADWEEEKTVDIEQSSSWEDKIVREIGSHWPYARKSSLASEDTLQLLCLEKTRMMNNQREVLVEDESTMFSTGEHGHRGLAHRNRANNSY
jgi:hypothetical protein